MKTTTRKQDNFLKTPVLLLGIGILALISSLADAEETLIYKSIAEDGSTVFTDQPDPEATIVNPAPLNVMDKPATQPAVAPMPVGTTSPAPKPIPAAIIDTVTITQPLDQQTFIDQEVPIQVDFAVLPAASPQAAALQPGVTANLRLDDEIVATGSSFRMPVDVPERGTHTLQIELVDQSGARVAESNVIQIHVKQHVAGSAN